MRLKLRLVNDLPPSFVSSRAQIMCPLHHSNLVKLFGGCWNEGVDKLCLVLEFCSRGSLLLLMDGTKRLGTWAEPRYQLAYGIALCFKYLHHGLNDTLIHRDLKPDNVLVSEDMQSKVADFGESKLFDEKRSVGAGALTMTMVGTALYCPPEARALVLLLPQFDILHACIATHTHRLFADNHVFGVQRAS